MRIRTFMIALLLCTVVVSCLLLCIVVVSCLRWTESKITESQRRGSKIVVALDKFEKTEGHFPINLDELVPNYIKKIEPPLAGNGRWSYRLYKNGEVFELSFEGDSPSEPTSSYRSSSKGWYLDTK